MIRSTLTPKVPAAATSYNSLYKFTDHGFMFDVLAHLNLELEGSGHDVVVLF